MNCRNCQAETSNGLALCDLCQRWARSALEYLPVYFRNLARWKPGRAGARPVPGSRVLYEGPVTTGGDRVGHALDEASNALTTWARSIEDDRGIVAPSADDEASQAVALSEWLREHLTTIATLEWCGEFIRELDHHERKLRALTEQIAPGWYAGECRGCSTPTHVVPGLTWVTCDGCGRTTYARDHLPTILAEMSDWVASPKRIAEAVVAMKDGYDSVDDLRKRIAIWGARGHLTVFRAHDHLPKHYRFGDVIDLLTRKSEAA